MDTLSRLIAVFGFLLFGCVGAFGNTGKTQSGDVYFYTTATNGAVRNSNTFAPTAAGACQAAAEALNKASPATSYKVTACVVGGACDIIGTAKASGVVSGDNCAYVASSAYVPGTCQYNSVEQPDGSCQCSAGFHQVGEFCHPNTTTDCQSRKAAAPAGGTDYTMAVWQSTATACDGGCTVRGSMSASTPGGTGGVIYNAKPTGETCSANPATGSGDAKSTDAEHSPTPLEEGQCAGTVNGATVAVPCGNTATQTGSTTTQKNADGTSTVTDKNTTCNGAGACSTTTTTTTYNSGGTQTGQSSTTKQGRDTQDGNSLEGKSDGTPDDPQPGFCEENPTATICKESSASASCAAGAASVTCDGDAVQCAMLREQFTRNCQLYDKTNPQSEAGAAAVAGGDQPNGHPHKAAETQSTAFGTAISQAPLIASACPADITVSMGSSMAPLVLPLSLICEPAGLLGNVGVGFAALACLFIVFKRD